MRRLGSLGQNRRNRDALRRAVVRGEAVTLECRLRRTSARGWGPWTDATVMLGALPDGKVGWHTDDPVSVGLPAGRGPVDGEFADLDDVWSRPVRFQTEAFWGMDGEILVLAAERSTTELAVPAVLSGPCFERICDQLGFERRS